MASEVTYNPYLRNGWVTIDTGVKGTAGTPFIEFSCFDFGESRYTVSLPNTMSFKFTLQHQTWRPGFLTRTSVIAQEPWFEELGTHSTAMNTYGIGRFFRKRDKFLSFFCSVNCMLSQFNILGVGLLSGNQELNGELTHNLHFSRNYFITSVNSDKNQRRRARFLLTVYGLNLNGITQNNSGVFLFFETFF